jgi:hypothetical protein
MTPSRARCVVVHLLLHASLGSAASLAFSSLPPFRPLPQLHLRGGAQGIIASKNAGSLEGVLCKLKKGGIQFEVSFV